jgi:hypothetical protein
LQYSIRLWTVVRKKKLTGPDYIKSDQLCNVNHLRFTCIWDRYTLDFKLLLQFAIILCHLAKFCFRHRLSDHDGLNRQCVSWRIGQWYRNRNERLDSCIECFFFSTRKLKDALLVIVRLSEGQ